jgi:hypothetical protein
VTLIFIKLKPLIKQDLSIGQVLIKLQYMMCFDWYFMCIYRIYLLPEVFSTCIYTCMQGIRMKSYLIFFCTTRMKLRQEILRSILSYWHRFSEKWLTIAREVTSRLGQLRGWIIRLFFQWKFRCYNVMFMLILHPLVLILVSIKDADFMKHSVTKLRIIRRKNLSFGIAVFLK